MDKNSALTGMEVAVIGMAGRFPGAKHIHEFWNNLKNSIESLSFLSDEELKESGLGPGLTDHPNYVKARGGVLEDKEYFDASFFGYSPREAELLNPQVRIFHEIAWESLEDAGYNPYTYKGLIGLFAGANSDFSWPMICQLSGRNEEMGHYAASQLYDKDYLSTRTSFKLNLKGPSIFIQTACSTSLAAIHLACQSILNGECDIALAGGIWISTQQSSGYIYQEGIINSPDGHCRAFDARAKGTIEGNGGGIVVLKPFKDAVDDRDHIYAVIKGTAINNDGFIKAGYTAPGVKGQAQVIRAALGVAEVEPESIGYIETHGTGTSLGDPIEIEALTLAFHTDKKQFCRIGSVKTNIGHLGAGAGVTGFIKAVLSLTYKQIPPSLNFEAPNPKIDFENSPFVVNTSLTEWKRGSYPRRAGVSSFGIGGTNAHVILQEAPAEIRDKEGTRGLAPLLNAKTSREYHLILLSAQTQSALAKMIENLAEYFKKNLLNRDNHENPTNPGLILADTAYTLQVGREAFKYRKMLVASSAEEVIAGLLSRGSTGQSFLLETDKKPVIFMFPGQGSQYVNMGLQLYHGEPVFREAMDRCLDILKSLVGYDIKEILYPGDSAGRGGYPYPPNPVNSPLERGAPEGRGVFDINQTEIAQPLIFAFEYALTQLLMAWGIQPEAMIGHSIGEYTAALVSGVFSLEKGLKLAAVRGKLMQQLPIGSMLSVFLSQQALTPLLPVGVSLAAVNGPCSCVVSGNHQALELFENQLNRKGYKYRRLHTSHAFHSQMMEPITAEFKETVKQIKLNPPGIPYISNITANWITAAQAANPAYWTNHLRQTVRFNDGLKKLLEKEDTVLVEVGPGKSLTAFVRQHHDNKSHQPVINLVRHPRENVHDRWYLLNKIGQLWLNGVEIDWAGFYAHEKRKRIPLPTYPFEKQRCWIDKDFSGKGTLSLSQKALSAEYPHKKKNTADFFYVPFWRQSLQPPAAAKNDKRLQKNQWLLFMDNCTVGAQLVKKLKKKKCQVIIAAKGNRFHKISDRLYRINPTQTDHYRALLDELYRLNIIPGFIIHLWNITHDIQEEMTVEDIEQMQYLGFYSLIYLARAIREKNLTDEFRISVVSSNLHEVTGEERLCPGKSTVLGPLKVIPQEFANMICRSIDIVLPGPGSPQEDQLIDQILAEILSESPETIIAYRNNRRWIQIFEAVNLGKGKTSQSPFRKKGVYLVTGGMGEIGLVLAEYLAQYLGARMVLTRRSAFPAKKEWKQWLETHKNRDRISQKIQKLQKIEELGGEVMVCQADAADPLQMKHVIESAEKRFGPLNGVIHAAGVTRGTSGQCPLEKISKTQGDEQFHPKIYGLLALEKVLKNKKIDFCLLTSSLSAILGGLGLAAYSAANIYMDTFVKKHNQRSSPPWISVNWDAWQSEEKRIQASLDQSALTPQGGAEAFQHILAWKGENQVVVSTTDLHTRFNQWIKLESLGAAGSPGEIEVISPLQPRPTLSTPYTAPSTPIAQTLAQIWQNFLGYHQVGIHDDFFQLGGDSLGVMNVAARIHKELKVEIPLTEFFNRPTIDRLAQYIGNTRRKEYTTIEPKEKRDYYPQSSAQKRLFFLDQFEEISTSYNMPFVFKVEGSLDKDRLENAFNALINRHESLRTSLHMKDNEAVQRVHEKVDFQGEYNDLEKVEVEVKVKDGDTEGTGGLAPLSYAPLPGESHLSSSHVIRHLSSEFIRPFDLSQPPLLRLGLITLSTNEYLLFFDMHHIISDGISMGVLVDDFVSLYEGEAFPPLKIQFKDFALWQNHLFETSKIKEQEAYWLKLYSDANEIPRLNLPMDYDSRRPPVFTFKGDTYGFKLENEDALRFKALGSENDATLFMNLLAVLNLLLYKYTGQEDIIIGCSIAGRSHVDLQRIIGMFVNELPVRNYPGGEKCYREFLKEVKASGLEAYKNQDMQFEELVDILNLDRVPSRNPLFDVCLSVTNFEQPRRKMKDVSVVPCDYKNKTSKFDITLFASEAGDELHFRLEYCTSLFKKETMEKMAAHFINIIRQVTVNPGIRLSEIKILSEEERKQLVVDFNRTGTTYPKDKTIHELFEEQAARTPGNIAVVGQGIGTRFFVSASQGQFIHITYRELNERSNRLANYLYGEKGIGIEHRIGILMNNSIDLIAAILGVLKAGGAYVPLEPSWPEHRIKNIMDDARAGIVISQKKYIRKLNRLQWECEFFHTFLCMDSEDIYGEYEQEKNELMEEKLWDYTAETAVDDITGGGWLTSFTGEPFSRQEMEEYGNNVLKKLLPFLHKKMRVLEIGCASGITMYRIAPGVGLYYGTDLSPVMIEKNRDKIKKEAHQNIRLSCVPAHDIETIEERDFDLVILNSVIQSFHGHNYLRQVIRKVVNLMAERGLLFIGDIMDQDFKKNLTAELIHFKRTHPHREKTGRTKTDWSSELFVSRSFFEDITVEVPHIRNVTFSKKIYTIENELTRFRYDALFNINKADGTKPMKIQKHKWQDDLRALTRQGTGRLTPRVEPVHTTYIIYTSGTTGKPKGVMIEHRSLVNYVCWAAKQYIPDKPGGCVFPLYTPLSFDLTVTSIFVPLISGNTTAVYESDDNHKQFPILDIIKSNTVDLVKATPSHLKLIQNEISSENSRIKTFIVGGEELESALAHDIHNRFPGKVDIYNEYGPTEATVGCMIHGFAPGRDTRKEVPIGLPVDNVKVYILDRDLNPVPGKAVGELCIAGDCLARGYLNQPGLTAEKFDHDLWDLQDYHDKEAPFGQILNAFGEREAHELHELPRIRATSNQKLLRGVQKREAGKLGSWEVKKINKNYKLNGIHASMQSCNHAISFPLTSFSHLPIFSASQLPSLPPGRRKQKIYKTGDLARWLSDGNIEFLGRIDQQVKIRGYRIELGEIENQLSKHPHIKETVVVTIEDKTGDKYLCAYIVTATRETSDINPGWPEELKQFLARSIPGYMIPAFFVSLEKIPLNSNGKIDRKALPNPHPGKMAPGLAATPQNEIEKKLIDIWQDILGIENIGLNSNFFRLGGHSLKIIILIHRIHKEFDVKISMKDIFSMVTIKELAQYIKQETGDEFIPLQAVEKREYYDVSHGQKRLWILNQFNEELAAYNMPQNCILKGKLYNEALNKALAALVEHHETLRTTFILIRREPKQKIHDTGYYKINIEYMDLRKEENPGEAARQCAREEAQSAFDLEKGPLLRVKLLHIHEDKYLFLFTMHHIISDGWSTNVLLHQLLTLYNTYQNNKANPLAPLSIQYKDYAAWHNKQLSGKRPEKLQEYWLGCFKGEIPLLELPTDYTRPPVKTFNGSSISFELNKEISNSLNTLAQTHETSLFMTLLAAVNVLLYWYTGQHDIVIGTPAAGREHMDLENQIGFYLNTLPLRTTFSGDDSFERLLDRVKTITLNAYEHQLYPFNLLVGELNAKPDASRSPLFDVVVQVLNFNLNINQDNQLKLQDITAEPYEIETAESKYDLTFNFWELPAGTGAISAILIYNSDLFKHETMVRMVNRFQELIQKILNNTIASLSDLCVETNIKIPTIKPISRRKPNPQSPGNKEKI